MAPSSSSAACAPDYALARLADGTRLSALRELGILDTPPETEFDRFTALVCDLLDAPVSLITLIDRDRQFFKSVHGSHPGWVPSAETPLSHSLCRHPVSTGKPLVVGDAHRDPRVHEHPAVRDLGAVAYLGVPLVLADGHAVGALCAIDTRPRDWSERDLRVLTSLAAAVVSMLDLLRALGRQSLHDALTGLPNRALVVAYGDQLSVAPGDSRLLALAIGIEGLGAVNASYGDAQGDRLINLVARRIAHELTDEDVLGRVHGDTFLVLRPGADGELSAIDLAHRIRACVCTEPLTIHQDRIGISATVGLAGGAPGADAGTLVARALACLEEAQERGERVRVCEPAERRRRDVRARLRGALSGAVRREEIAVNFQPIVELASGRTRGYEALARWRHPEFGLVGPAEFIPIAEETGDIMQIGEHVLRTACIQLALWREMLPGEQLGVTVNVSPLQLAVPGIAELVGGILADSGLPAGALTLEITEGVFMAPGALPRRHLAAIRALGVRIALDDFGTGYSALAYLKGFPVDLIKVDRCFLDGLETDHRHAALMQAILSIGTGMELEVIVEGVETAAQRELLARSGCEWAQGFLFAEPLPAEEVRLPVRRPRRADPERDLVAVD